MRQIANRRLWFSSRKLMNDPKDLMTINTDLLSEDEKNYYYIVVSVNFIIALHPASFTIRKRILPHTSSWMN